MYTKPLYEAQKEIEYMKHLERLKKISNKKVNGGQKPIFLDQMHRIRNHSSEYQVKQKNNLLTFENNKILNKLLQISQRTSVPAYSTIASHCVPKKPSSIIIFNNPQRKKRQKQILDTNNKLARRLLTKQSQFDRSKTIKSIEQYENVRKILQNNRRIKLIPLHKQSGGYQFSRVATTQNSRIQLQKSKTIDNLTNQVSLADTNI